jgi:outer membrane receptor protein involved in Fe transport
MLAPRQALAQVSTGSIEGTVKDVSGAVVPDATVDLTNSATSIEQSTTTNDTGEYVLVKIVPGSYALKVSKNGFETEVSPPIDLQVNQSLTLDFTLKVGAAAEVVTVTGQATGLQTASAELGTVISKTSVDSLPLNGRNFTQLLDLTPGVSTVNVSQNSGNQQFDGNPVGEYSFPAINGQTNRSNLFLLDGLNDQESFESTYSVPPIIDTIQEFKIDTHNDSAAFGGVLGGVVNVVTKSGGNAFHGEGWEFLRNSFFDAKSPLATTNVLHQNQFGGSVGGPVILPKYNGRNKTFFYGAYEGARIHPLNTAVDAIPTGLELNNYNFNSEEGSAQLYNPWSTVAGGSRMPFACVAGVPVNPNPNGTQTGGTPCNILPSIATNPVACAQTIATGPNVPGCVDANMAKVTAAMYGGLLTSSGASIAPCASGVAAVDNFCPSPLTVQDPNSFTVRLDEQLGDKDSIWIRYSYNNTPRNVQGPFYTNLQEANVNSYDAKQLGASWQHTFGSSSVLTMQFGRNYAFSKQPTLLPQAESTTLLADGGYANSWACAFQGGTRPCYFNSVDPASVYTAFQEGEAPALLSNIWEGRTDFSFTHGRHTISMGVDINTNGFQQTFNASNEQTSTQQTASNSSGGAGGDAFASLLLGVPNNLTYRNEYETENDGWEYGVYLMDQWRATDKLTLNLGARYDVDTIPKYGGLNANSPVGDMDDDNGTYIIQSVAPTCGSTGGKAPCIPANPPACAYTAGVSSPNNSPCLPAGLTPALSGALLPNYVAVSNDGYFWHTQYDNIQPRIGLAYRLRDKTVIRASVGRFFDNWAAVLQTAQNQQGGWPQEGQFIATTNQSAAPPTVFVENPLQGANSSPAAVPFAQNNWYVDPNLKNPESWQWNFGIQQAVTSATTLTVNYVGSKDTRLDVGVVGNEALTPDATGIGISAACYYYAPTTAGSCDPQVMAAQGTYAYPYLQTFHYDKSIGEGWYDALQVTLNSRVSHGLQYLIAYTWSRSESICADEWYGNGSNGTSCEDSNNNPDGFGNKAVSSFDVPQILRVSLVYALPFGAGSMRTGSGIVNHLVGGWQVNGIISFASGTPYTINANASVLGDGSANVSSGTNSVYERANAVAGVNPVESNPTTKEWFNTAAFSQPTCSALQAGYPNSCFGDIGRNTLRADATNNIDFSVFRDFKFTENKFFEFRAEAFNLFNSPIYGLPNAATGSTTFGTVTSMANNYTPRQMQFALKFYY